MDAQKSVQAARNFLIGLAKNQLLQVNNIRLEEVEFLGTEFMVTLSYTEDVIETPLSERFYKAIKVSIETATVMSMKIRILENAF